MKKLSNEILITVIRNEDKLITKYTCFLGEEWIGTQDISDFTRAYSFNNNRQLLDKFIIKHFKKIINEPSERLIKEIYKPL
jgi:hypothetical protein